VQRLLATIRQGVRTWSMYSGAGTGEISLSFNEKACLPFFELCVVFNSLTPIPNMQTNSIRYALSFCLKFAPFAVIGFY
jgi:hypothetical protein